MIPMANAPLRTLSLLSCFALLLWPGSALRAQSLDELLADYVRFGLPLPPKDTPLVAVTSGWQSVAPDGKETPHVHLAFLLRPATDQKPAVVLVGTEEHELPREGTLKRVSPDDIDVAQYKIEWRNSTFEINGGLATALQFQSRGWQPLAAAQWKHATSQPPGHLLSLRGLRSDTEPRVALVVTAWAHYANQLLLPKSDRARILQAMKTLSQAHEIARTEYHRTLIADLERTLQPTAHPPETPAWHIDRLMDLAGTASIFDEGCDNPHYEKLVELGFDAVPALMEHLDDPRLTRSAMARFNNFAPHIRRVDEICSDILRGLMSDKVGEGWFDRQRGIAVRRAEIQGWFDRVRKQGERAYLVEHVLGQDCVVLPMLRVLAIKYPDTLPDLYLRVLNSNSEIDSSALAQALNQANLDLPRKVELLTQGATHARMEHRRAALWALKDADGALFVRLLVESLDRLPRTPNGEYWCCSEAGFANLVMETDASAAWTALRNAAQRADVGLRMEFLNPMDYDYIGERQRKQRLEFLASFLDDASLRDVSTDPEKFGGPLAGMGFDRLTVRDFAALQMASILGFEDRPTPNWTEPQWSQLRARVRAAKVDPSNQ